MYKRLGYTMNGEFKHVYNIVVNNANVILNNIYAMMLYAS